MNDEDLRDLFAGLALQGMLADNSNLLNINGEKYVSEYCYILADAMLEAKYAELKPNPDEGITAIKPKRKRSANVPPVNS
jgi:hypothetical protein